MKCETTPLGATAADGRFRIFKEGAIRTDYGLSIMTPSAGRAVINRFESRGNDMPIDLRHGMLAENPTLDQSLAYGWIPCPGGLEYVKGDGLYARGVQWDPRVKAALQVKPAQIRYFSPTYDIDPKTRVILELTNIALTNLPATHGLNRLAAERGRSMDLEKCGQLLAMLMAKADAGDEEAAAMRDMLIAALGDQVEAALAAAGGGDAGDVAPESEDITAGMSDAEKNAYEALSDNMKAALVAGIKAQRAESDKTVAAEGGKDQIAAAASEEVAAEGDKSKVAASISAEQILLMADAEAAKTIAPRQKIVAELVTSGKITKGGEVEKILLDPTLPEQTFNKVVASRKTVSRAAPGPVPGKISVGKPAPRRDTLTISAEDRNAVERLSKKLGTDPSRAAKKLAELG